MRRIRILILSWSAMLLTLTGAARAHGEAEALGHHWEIPAYMHEIHLQLTIMATVTMVVGIAAAIKRISRRKDTRQ